MEAGITSLASRAAVSLINNKFDLGKTAKTMTSAESLKALGQSMGISVLTFGITEGTGFGAVTSGAGRVDRFASMASKGVVQGSVSSLVTGESLNKSLERAGGSSLLAMGQSVVGDIGQSGNLSDGGLAKTIMHSAVGGVYSGINGGSFASGAIGGGVGEVVAGVMGSGASESSPSAVKSVAQVAGNVVSFASGGSEKAITTSGSVALSAVENNHDLHQIQALLEMEARGELETGTTVEDLRQQPLGQAAEFVVENPARALDISTDIASIVYSGGLQGAVAKKGLVSGISKATKLVGFGKKPVKVEKLTGPVGGLVIDHMPVGSSITTSTPQSALIKGAARIGEGAAGIASPPSVVVKKTRPLLPNEGRVGSYGELTGVKGDNLTPHHIPSAAYIKQFGIKSSKGISIMLEHPHPGSGGRHRKTDTYGKRPNLSVKPRNELAKDILDLRNIYKEDNVYTPEIRENLQEVIKQNKEKFPEIYQKRSKDGL